MPGQTRKIKKPRILAYGRGNTGYGDVHHPSLPCRDSERSPVPLEDYISKSMTRTDALRELRDTRPMRERKFDFVIVPEDFCLGEGKLRTGRGKDRRSLPQDRYLLIAKYGGVTIREYTDEMIKQAERLAVYLQAIKELRKNIQTMNEENFFHRDLTDLNITYDEEKGKAFLIDFEKMDREPLSQENINRLRNNYNNNVNPNDETYIIDQIMYYLLGNLKDKVLGALDPEDLRFFGGLPDRFRRRNNND